MSKPSMFVKLTAQPGQRDQVVAAFDRMLVSVAEEPGTEVYSIHLDDADEDVVWIFEMYADQDALATHSSSPAMATLITEIGPLLGGDAAVMSSTTAHAGKGLAH